VLTHPDGDHLGVAVPVLEEVRVKRLLTNGVEDDTHAARQVRERARAQQIPTQLVAAGMEIMEEPDVRLLILHPPGGLVSGVPPESNDNSIVIKLVRGEVSVLLTGDIEEAGLPVLLRHAGTLRSTILKVPHHGSRLGDVGERFFSAVQPAIAILSVGRLHHLPAPQTLQALEATGASRYSTRDDGAIRVRTDGHRFDVRTFREHE
jgi:competence protein ComEC